MGWKKHEQPKTVEESFENLLNLTIRKNKQRVIEKGKWTEDEIESVFGQKENIYDFLWQTSSKDNPYYKPEAEPSGNFAGTAEQNINLLNTMARQKFQEDSPGSSLGGTFDFNVASSGGYDSTAYTLRGNNENVDALSSQELDERGIVMDYPDINLKGLNVKQTWDKLGIGGWDDRASLWDKYMSGGA